MWSTGPRSRAMSLSRRLPLRTIPVAGVDSVVRPSGTNGSGAGDGEGADARCGHLKGEGRYLWFLVIRN